MTRALGVDEVVELELQTFDVQVGDVYLMCSDGLSDMVADATIAQILMQANNNMSLAADKLIDTANGNGGHDNISVIIAQVNKAFTPKKSWVSRLLKN